MDAEHQERIQALFTEASRLPSDERAPYLDRHCNNDTGIRTEVESLLAHDDDAFLANPPDGASPEVRGAEVGRRIGGYRILSLIGAGGMGEVYLAEQERPVRRHRVALKLIKLGMDTRQVVTRFESERQALAMMDHPHIARVLDAGATERGRPYFVMEYVPGVPITEHCDRHRLTLKERLKLFLQACEGVQHAHQKGIIHRDIKPSNVLVSFRDGEATVKIIDFGVAKAIDHRLTQHTVYTEYGQMVGTPEYMSPEQAEMTEQDIDTRTDIYSLGVLLYELLVGARPIDSRELRRDRYDELRCHIREIEPPRPSLRLMALGEVGQALARRRGLDATSLSRRLRGDLDWVTMKALEKDRTRRYSSASELAVDIRRFMTDEPVLARPPSAVYRVRKFTRRHRAGVVISAVGVLALLSGLAGTTAGLVRARQAERIARQKALAHKGVSDFFVYYERGYENRARELAEACPDVVETEEIDSPEVAWCMSGEAWLLSREGDARKAEALLREAVEIWSRASVREYSEMAHSYTLLGWLLVQRGEFGEAETMLQRSFEVNEQALGPDHPDTLIALYELGCLAAVTGDRDKALNLLGEAVDRGFADPVIFDDPKLGPLRGDARLQPLIDRVRERDQER